MTYLDDLNPAQKEAVQTTEGPVVVLAGAGSGKTKVLTTRIYHLIRQGVAPETILAVTFTNKAAREMRERVAHMLGGIGMRGTGPFIATFHSLGRELLERYGAAIGLPRYFSVYDREDSEKLVANALKALDVETKELSPRAVLGRISRAKGEGITARDFYEKQGRSSFVNRTVAEVWLRYEKALAEEKALDFDDLLVRPVRLLETHQEICADARQRWRYIHIDEYQDTNAQQERLAALLAGDAKNVFVVGDGDQSIYGWRGAKMENILEFEERYPGAKLIVLSENYRSTKTLVDAANAVIEKNKNRKEKVSTTSREAGAPIALHVAATAEHEALWIARRIRALLREGVVPDSIAVLFRTNFQSRALEEGLLREGVPYKLLGTHFFARKEVKDVLAWVRLALDPTREADRVRAVAAPSRGIGKVTLAKIAAGQLHELRATDKAKVDAFEETVATLHAASATLCASEFVKLVIEKSGIRRALYDEGSADDRERFENVEELASVATRHDALVGQAGIAAFVADAALASDQDELDTPSRTQRGVVLMTVHAAKGLEFDTVFVSGMEEGLFPHEGFADKGDRDEEEERRLFYVAMTRAKERLFLTLARVRKIYGSDYYSAPSSFLADIDRTLIRLDEGDEGDVIEL